MSEIRLEYSQTSDSLKDLLSQYASVYVVYDENVSSYVDELFDENTLKYAVRADENNKNIEAVISICRWLMSHNADRDAIVVAVGGGVTTDIAGFAASIYKRGVRYANVPTTLLSQVDAAVGGKTGVNVDSFKNMIGLIVQPVFTFISPSFLKTLPEREILSGIAELLKTFIIMGESDYKEAVSQIKQGAPVWEMGDLILKAAQYKADIVRKDENDKGVRHILNLGHTYGHAIEWYEHSHMIQNPLTHGEAVAIGIIVAARIAASEGYCDKQFVTRLETDFRDCGLPVELPYDEVLLCEAISLDKKSENGKIHMVYPAGFGKIVIG